VYDIHKNQLYGLEINYELLTYVSTRSPT
jgi:hypothetical protein